MPETEIYVPAQAIHRDWATISSSPQSLAPLSRTARWFRLLVLGIAAGYLVFGRTFAYFGVPGLYPGELLLLAAACTRYSWVSVFLSFIRHRPAFAISVSLFFIWGCAEGLRGYIAGYPVIDVILGLPAHYYPFLLFAGISAGKVITEANLRRYFAWLSVAAGLSSIFSTLASNFDIFGWGLPWAPDVLVLAGASMTPFCLLAYAALSKRVDFSFFAIAAPSVIALLIGGRGSLLGAIIGFLILAFRPGRLQFILRLAIPAFAGLVLWIGFAGFLPDFGGRSGRATPSLVAARLVSVVDARLAASLVEGTDADLVELTVDAGDAEWRRELWSATIQSLTSTSDWFIGHGYGPVLGDLLPGTSGEGYGHDLRTPHNFAIYLLGYTGLVGCACYLALLIAILMEIAAAPASAVKDAAIATGASVIVMALTGNLFETPFGAVPAYVCTGVLLAVASGRNVRDRE